MFGRIDQHIIQVSLFGAIGGFLAWVIHLWQGQPTHLGIWIDAPISIVLGTGASMVFVYLISNTDRADRARLFALALVAGVFWEPVWEAGKALVDRKVEQSRQRAALDATNRATELAAALPSVSQNERDKILANIGQELQRAKTAVGKLDSLSSIQQVKQASEPLLANDWVQTRPELRTLAASLDPMSGERLRTAASYAAVATSTSAAIVPETISRSDLPPDDSIRLLTPGDRFSGDASKMKTAWFRFGIRGTSAATIQVTSSKDLVAAVYSKDSLRLIASDDDSGGNGNPKLSVQLSTGEYLARVSSFDSSALPRFHILFKVDKIAQ